MPDSLQPKLRLQQVVPGFDLPSSTGGRLGLWDLKPQRNMVMFFFHGGTCRACRDLLAGVAQEYQRFKEFEAEVIAVTTQPPEQAHQLASDLSLPFPVLSDPSGQVVRQYTYVDPNTGGPVPSLFVVDRFGALYTQVIAEDESQLPPTEEVLDWLELIETECPECGAPEWPSVGA